MTVGHSLNVLVVDDEVNIRKTLTLCLETEGHKVVAVSNFQDALTEASRKSFELAFVDLRLGVHDGLDLIPALLAASPWIKIVVITAYASIDTAVEAMRRGATDYIPKPFTPAQVMVCLSSRGPNSGKLLRYASRLAGKLNRNWYAVYVQTQSEEATAIDVRTQSLLSDTLTLAKQLGVEDVNTEKPIEIVFLILSPAQTPDAQVQILGLSSRAAQSRHLLQNLGASRTPGEAMKAICDRETENEACVTNSIS